MICHLQSAKVLEFIRFFKNRSDFWAFFGLYLQRYLNLLGFFEALLFTVKCVRILLEVGNMKTHKEKIDHVFNTLESKGYECLFRDGYIYVTKLNPNTGTRSEQRFAIETGVARDAALKNTAKAVAHHYGLRYNGDTNDRV